MLPLTQYVKILLHKTEMKIFRRKKVDDAEQRNTLHSDDDARHLSAFNRQMSGHYYRIINVINVTI